MWHIESWREMMLDVVAAEQKPLIHRLYGIFLPHFRRRRMANLDHLLLDRGVIESVIDLGGDEAIWQYSDHRPRVTIVNTQPRPDPKEARFTVITADATDLDWPDDAFDLSFSNSVIEHVGEQRWAAFAAECRRLAPAVFVQTPARAFPFEPHLLTPLVHYLPKRIQRRVLRYGTVWGLVTRPTGAEVDDFVDSTTLLTKQQMVELFPDCEIRTERFLGLPKSYIAMRTSRAGSITDAR